MPSRPSFSLVLVSFMTAMAGAAADAPRIEALAAPQLWRKAEFRVVGAPEAGNAFDPDRIRLDATFTAPSGATVTVPAFWYRDFKRTLVDGVEKLTPLGEPEWRLRFTPTEPGEYSLALDIALAGAPAARPAEIRFAVPAAAIDGQHGWVQRAPGDRWLQTSDGRPLRLIGANVCWGGARGTYDYDMWFDDMAAAGENFARLWMSPWGIGLEHNPGTLNRYELADAWQLDHVFDLAEERGIYLMLSFDHHGMYFVNDPSWGGSNNFWTSSNPYSAALGGPCATPNAFFTSPQAKAIYQKRLRYLLGRYGCSEHLLAWQFFNEIDNAYLPRSDLVHDDVVAWHREMGQWFRVHDPWRHLVTTSLTGGSDRPGMWTIPEMDLAVYHSYWDPAPMQTIARLSDSFVRRYGKPVMIGEFGTSSRELNLARDPHLRGFRQGLWGGALGGSVGTAMSWWWEDLHSENVYPLYAAMKTILDAGGWSAGDWTPVQFGRAPQPGDLAGELPGAEPFGADLALNDFRRIVLPGAAVIANPLAAERASEFLSTYLRAERDTAMHRPMKLTAWFGPAARLVLGVDSVAADAELRVRVDGAEVLREAIADIDGAAEVNGEIERTFSIALAPGKHLIEITNTGRDWIAFSRVRLEGVRPAAFADGWDYEPELTGLRQGRRAIVYACSPRIVYPAGARRFNPAPVSGASATLLDWPDGRYTARWFDPRTGAEVATTEGTAAGGALAVALPELSEDLAGIVEPLEE